MKPRLGVVTPLFPTPEEPHRGAPVWATLERLRELAELTVYCTAPDYPGWMRRLLKPRSYLRFATRPDPARWPVPLEAVRFTALPGLSRSLNGWSISRALRPLVERDRPQALLAFWIYPEGYGAVRLGRALGLPVAVCSRGSDLRVPPPGVRGLTAETVRRAGAVLCVSQDLGAIARRLGAAGERVHVIHNGVDTAVFRPGSRPRARQRLGLPPASRITVFVGRLVAAKGVVQLVDAVAALRAGGRDWHAVLIGEGALESELRRRAETAGIAAAVHLPGAQTPQQIAEWLAAADLLALPSDTEGCPNVILEAHACGRPVVATDVGGIPELVSDDSGILLASNDAEAIAQGLERAAAHSWDLDRIAATRRRGWAEVAAETLAVCERLIAEAPPR